MTQKRLKTIKVRSKQESRPASSFWKQVTTFHGTHDFATKKGKGLFLWSVLMIANLAACVVFLAIIQERFNKDQIVTKIYSDYSIGTIPFPAVTICNFNRVSLRQSKTIETILVKNNVPKHEIESFFRDLYHLVDFTENVDNHSTVLEILKRHYYNVEIIMEEVHQKCENLLVYCEFNSIAKDCNDIFMEIKTYNGFCCSFNFDGIEDELNPMIDRDEDFDYYIDSSPDGEEILSNIVVTSQYGSSSGLHVVFNVEPEDYASWAAPPAYGAKIILSDPNDYVETRVYYSYISVKESMDIKVEPMVFDSEENLRSVDTEIRGCYFHDEANLINTNRYSYETCYTECKIKSYINFCGCIPFNYPIDKSTRICEFADLECLHYMRVHWESTKVDCVPKCYKECRDKAYSLVTDTVPFIPEHYPENVISGRNVSELSAVHVYYVESTCNCYIMSLLTDVNSFIATYGGIFSLCFGASIMTFCELAYLGLASAVKTFSKYALRNTRSKCV